MLLLISILSAPARADDQARAALHQQADALHLAATPGWRGLLHIAPGRARSDVVDDWFFLAPQGGDDPARELHATLDALLDNTTLPLREEPAACVFSARRAFLAATLGDAFTRLAPEPDCPRRQAWLDALQARQLWLVFPTGYLNSPSSMFGHTLLRIDSDESAQRGPLLAYAANFIAETGESNGLVFAIKGLTGGYTGRYGVLPYYEKVREYVRLESRDLWEYPLQLSEAERQQVLLHLWELRGAGFTYYFFSRNCAYQLLALLQTVRPEQNLLASFKVWAAPTDTIRALQSAGWLGAPRYRPALATTLRQHAAQLDAAQQMLAADLSYRRQSPDALANASPETQARVLDVAHDLTYLRFQAGGDRDSLLATDRALLAARAATGSSSHFDPVPPPDTPPDQAHGTQRVAVGWQAREGAQQLLLHYRPGYHDLLDDPAGYTEGSQVNFADTALRMDLRNAAVKFDEFRLIDIVSLARRDRLLSPISWRASLGARRDLGADTPLRGYLEAAPGLAWGNDRGWLWLYAPLSFESGPRLARGYDLRAGLSPGALWLIAPQWRAMGELRWQGGIAGAAREQWRAQLGLQHDFSRDWALRLEAVSEDLSDHPAGRSGWQSGGTLSLQRYF